MLAEVSLGNKVPSKYHCQLPFVAELAVMVVLLILKLTWGVSVKLIASEVKSVVPQLLLTDARSVSAELLGLITTVEVPWPLTSIQLFG